MSRKDIAQTIGLTPAAVTLICSELIEAGILEEKGEAAQEKRVGRKKILVDINYTYKKILCIQIEIDETYLTLTDLAGTVYAKKTLPTDRKAEPETFLRYVAAQSKDMIWESDIARDEILAGGVSVTGIVDRMRGISVKSFRLWEASVDVKGILEEILGFEIVVENNVKAFAAGELIYGDGRAKNNLMFVKWGPGVGSAITISHQVYQGRDFRGAEIGHYIVEKNGTACRCGKRGCLETVISSHAIVRDVKAQFSREQMPALAAWLADGGHELKPRNIAEWAGFSDVGLQHILDEKIDRLARTVENVISILNPDNVVVYGNMFALPGILERFVASCKAYDPELTDGYIVKSQLDERITYIGSLAIVMDEYFF